MAFRFSVECRPKETRWENIFRCKNALLIWGLIHGGAYSQNFTVVHERKTLMLSL